MQNLFQHNHYTFSFNCRCCAVAEAENVRKAQQMPGFQGVQMDWISNAHSLLMAWQTCLQQALKVCHAFASNSVKQTR